MIHEPSMVPDTAPWDVAEAELDRWRGACVQIFARSEAATTETLLVLAEQAATKVRLPQMVGQRYETLDAAVAVGGAPAVGAARLKSALDAFRAHDDLRTILCHGTAQVAIDRHGEWVAVLRCTSCRSSGIERIVRTFTATQAEEALAHVRRDGQILNSLLGQLRKSMKTEG